MLGELRLHELVVQTRHTRRILLSDYSHCIQLQTLDRIFSTHTQNVLRRNCFTSSISSKEKQASITTENLTQRTSQTGHTNHEKYGDCRHYVFMLETYG